MKAQDQSAIDDLVRRLMHCGLSEGAAKVAAHVRQRPDAAGPTAEALLRQPASQLRAHGLLAARLGAQADLVLPVLLRCEPGVWKAAAAQLCQMELHEGQQGQLLEWLLRDAAPAPRNYLLTRLGRQKQRPLGAQLFAALLAAGRPELALRLVRHAGALPDAELEPLLREHLVTLQGASSPVPTWARQAWTRAAAARPSLALRLLTELRDKVPARPAEARGVPLAYTCLLMLRRPMLCLLSGRLGEEAARELLVSEEEHWEWLDRELGWASGAAPRRPAFHPSSAKLQMHHWRKVRSRVWTSVNPHFNTEGCAFTRRRNRACLGRLERDASGGASTDAQRAAAALYATLAFGQRRAALRWAHRLERRGLLGWLLGQATSEDSLPVCNSWRPPKVRRMARLAGVAAKGFDASAPLVAVAAANLVRRTGDVDSLRAVSRQPWKVWEAWQSDLQRWPVELLAAGAEALLARIRADPEEWIHNDECAAALTRLVAFLRWEDPVRSELLQHLRTNRVLADERAEAYCEALQSLPVGCSAAADEVALLVLSRTRNESGRVRVRCLTSFCDPVGGYTYKSDALTGAPLSWMSDSVVSEVEAAIHRALAAPDDSDGFEALVQLLVGRMLQLGVRRPHSVLLDTALRLHRKMLHRAGLLPTPLSSGALDGGAAHEPADGASCGGTPEGDARRQRAARCAPDPVLECRPLVSGLQRSTDPQHAVRVLLEHLLARYKDAGMARAAWDLLDNLAAEMNGEPMRSADLPAELTAAFGGALAAAFPGSRWQLPAASWMVAGAQLPGSGGGAGGDNLSAHINARCGPWLAWWLLRLADDAGLQRVKASLLPKPRSCCMGGLRTPLNLLEPPGGEAAALCLLRTSLCNEWLLQAPRRRQPPPAAVWFRRHVLSSDTLMAALTTERLPLCRHLLRKKGGDNDLRAAVLVSSLDPYALCGIVPAHDSQVLDLMESTAPGRLRLERCAQLLRAYRKDPEALQFWSIKRGLRSTDLSRWPPAVQAKLRRLCCEVAGAADSEASDAIAAVCLLLRLQDASVADLEPLAADARLMPTCLLIAPLLPDKSAAARFLHGWLAGENATLAASALRRMAAHLPDAELVELSDRVLSAPGGRAAAWHQVVVMLLERGGAQALELVYAQMARPNLAPSMRCGLLSSTGSLTNLPRVAAFWEQCAAEGDEEAVRDVIACINLHLLKRYPEVADWWSKVVVGLLRTSEPTHRLPEHLWNSGAFITLARSPAALQSFVDGLLPLAASPDQPQAIWLLRRIVKQVAERNPGFNAHPAAQKWDALKGSLARFMRTLLEASAAELDAAAGADAAGTQERPATGALLQLLRGKCTALSPWRLGLEVPPPLVPLLWDAQCAYLATAVGDVESVAADGGGAWLALELRRVAAAAPSSAHVAAAGGAMLRQIADKWSPSFSDEGSARDRQYLETLMAVAAELGGAASDGSPAHSAAGAAAHLSIALAGAAWHATHEWRRLYAGEDDDEDDDEDDGGLAPPAMEKRALAFLRRCMASDSQHIAHVLLNPSSFDRYRSVRSPDDVFWELREQLTGTTAAELARRAFKATTMKKLPMERTSNRLRARINWLRY